MRATRDNCYLESARSLEQKPPVAGGQPVLVYCVDRVERALRLARMINDAQQFNKLAGYVEELVRTADGEACSVAPRLADLLIEFRVGEPLRYASIAKEAAERAEAQNAVDSAREFWTRQAEWLRLTGDAAGERAARVSAAETYVRKADLRAANRPTTF